ncbi:transglycosylase domain-containing protein [Isobaculum melis]|uniref:Penicillin-binding protein 1A n=1 Tax=Isobaculum melis TaxID=142588 RepID=A0A1H9RYM4_9LACT|nr:PBP1A family penicillin-binding protein [Isobaculum melis]SER76979.1 penicillin-binding protein 1A [Isobaculum melis]
MSENKSSRVNRNKKPTKRKKKTTKRKTWKVVLWSILGLLTTILLVGGGLFAYYVASAPELTKKDLTDAISSKILAGDDSLIKEIGTENREYIEYSEVPDPLRNAVISIEDRRFNEHHGIDPIRIFGALFANAKSGGIAQGGSTLTQQLVKLSVFSTEAKDQTIKRKAQEAWLSLKLEREYSKDQIFEFYINKVYLGNGVYGMETASQYYFGKPLTDISIAQTAFIAGLPQSPNEYDPYTNPELATTRRNQVLNAMVENDKLSQADADTAKNEDIQTGLIDHSQDASDTLVNDAYIQQVIAEVEASGHDIYTEGLTVHTNLDVKAQQAVFDILNSDEYVDYKTDNIQAGVSMVDVNDGAVKALGGGRNQNAQQVLNRATQAKRSIGSTVKPLADYGPAIDELDYSTYTQIKDEPYHYSNGQELKNYDLMYKGSISMRQAIIESRNIPALKVFQDVGIEKSEAFLKKLGITPTDFQEASSIGAGIEVSPMDLSAAYAAFANGGTYYKPHTVNKIVLQDDTEIDLKPAGEKAMEDYTAYMMTDMLKDVVRYGVANDVAITGLPMAGKTGTTDYGSDEMAAAEKNGAIIEDGDAKDSWFSGYTKNYSISVWTGYDKPLEENSQISVSQYGVARSVFHELIASVYEGSDTSDWEMPSSVVKASVEKGTNPAKKPGPNTPLVNILQELFVKGTEPSSISTSFGTELKAPTGLNAVYDQTANHITINWDAYDTSGYDVTYLLTIDGTAYQTKDLSYVLQAPPAGKSITITLAAQFNGSTSPSVSVNVEVPATAEKKPDKEPPKEEEKEKNSDESHLSSESSSSLESESSSE